MTESLSTKGRVSAQGCGGSAIEGACGFHAKHAAPGLRYQEPGTAGASDANKGPLGSTLTTETHSNIGPP